MQVAACLCTASSTESTGALYVPSRCGSDGNNQSTRPAVPLHCMSSELPALCCDVMSGCFRVCALVVVR